MQNGVFELLAHHVEQLEEADRREGNLDKGYEPPKVIPTPDFRISPG